MTSSETQTNRSGAAALSKATLRSKEELLIEAGGGQRTLPVLTVLTVAGWLFIMAINRWHFGPPVFFLCAGWLSVLLTIRFLWSAGMSAALDTDTGDDEFWKPIGLRAELNLEKRSLLKAIKEIEFDHQMGKMSDADAAELSRFYRSRAIEVIKALDKQGAADEDLSVSERIEQELRARMAVETASAKGKGQGAKQRKRADERAEKKASKSGKKAGKKADKTEDKADKTEDKADKTEDKAEDKADKAEDKADKADKAEDEAEDKAEADDDEQAAADEEVGS